MESSNLIKEKKSHGEGSLSRHWYKASIHGNMRSTCPSHIPLKAESPPQTQILGTRAQFMGVDVVPTAMMPSMDFGGWGGTSGGCHVREPYLDSCQELQAKIPPWISAAGEGLQGGAMSESPPQTQILGTRAQFMWCHHP